MAAFPESLSRVSGSRYATELAKGSRNMRFPPALEREYHALYLAERRSHVRSFQNLRIERDGRHAPVTVSVGVAIVLPTLERSPEGAVQLADEALYAAKREGRNRVVVFEREHDAMSTGQFKAPLRQRDV